MSTDGFDEADFIMGTTDAGDGKGGIGNLCGGQVWTIKVPKKHTLAKSKDETLPYITCHFPTPISLGGGSFADGEEDKPHLMSFTVFVHAESEVRLRVAVKAVLRRLTGLTPSTTGNAGEIKRVGGYLRTYPNSDRMTQAIVFHVVIGLAGPST